jgi:methylmalonyl-CoA epimerase
MKAVLDHIGVAVDDLAAALRFYQDALGLDAGQAEEVPEQGVRIRCLPVGDASIELLEATRADSPVGRFLARRGPGLHHLTLRVDDIEAALGTLKARGVRLVDETPRVGAGGARIAFVHPSATQGVLVELTQRDD